MLFSRAMVLSALSMSVAAVPYEKSWFDGARRSLGFRWATGSSRSIDKRQPVGSDLLRRDSSCSSSLANVKLPESSLPAPSEGLSLYHVAVGRGTQNYTCDFTNTTAVPTSIGATANLYDADCSASCPTLSQELPMYLLEGMAYPAKASTAGTNPLLIGHHFFSDATTAYFNLDDSHHVSWGQGGFGKTDSADAPASAMPGKGKQAHGAVPWLKLQAKSASQPVFQEIYRVNTAGGQPPPSCKALTGEQRARVRKHGVFTIQYAAEYWFFS